MSCLQKGINTRDLPVEMYRNAKELSAEIYPDTRKLCRESK